MIHASAAGRSSGPSACGDDPLAKEHPVGARSGDGPWVRVRSGEQRRPRDDRGQTASSAWPLISSVCVARSAPRGRAAAGRAGAPRPRRTRRARQRSRGLECGSASPIVEARERRGRPRDPAAGGRPRRSSPPAGELPSCSSRLAARAPGVVATRVGVIDERRAPGVCAGRKERSAQRPRRRQGARRRRSRPSAAPSSCSTRSSVGSRRMGRPAGRGVTRSPGRDLAQLGDKAAFVWGVAESSETPARIQSALREPPRGQVLRERAVGEAARPAPPQTAASSACLRSARRRRGSPPRCGVRVALVAARDLGRPHVPPRGRPGRSHCRPPREQGSCCDCVEQLRALTRMSPGSRAPADRIPTQQPTASPNNSACVSGSSASFLGGARVASPASAAAPQAR